MARDRMSLFDARRFLLYSGFYKPDIEGMPDEDFRDVETESSLEFGKAFGPHLDIEISYREYINPSTGNRFMRVEIFRMYTPYEGERLTPREDLDFQIEFVDGFVNIVKFDALYMRAFRFAFGYCERSDG